MVIDNADDIDIFFGGKPRAVPGRSDDDEDGSPAAHQHEGSLAAYLPESCRGALLITTRNKQVGVRLTKGSSPIEVDSMDQQETLELLHTRLGEVGVTPEDASALASRVAYLPLAIAQAASFIQENCITISQYIQLLDQGDQDFVNLLSEEFETVGRDSETPRALTETWILSFEQIQRQNPLAAELLSLMSFFDRQAIPLKLLSLYHSDWEEQPPAQVLSKALGLLKAFSLVAENNDSGFAMHRLVQLVTHKWLSNTGTIQDFAHQAVLTMSRAFPSASKEGYSQESDALADAYWPHAQSVLGH
jgi:hypothetical protein